MSKIDNFPYFKLNRILESHYQDWDWDYETEHQASKVDKVVNKLSKNLTESKDKLTWLKKFFDKITKIKLKKKHGLMIIIGVISLFIKLVPNSQDEVLKIANTSLDSETVNIIEYSFVKDISRLKRGYEFQPSKKIIDFIKEEEKLRLNAYTIGDGKVTIGYGHAEPISKSKYKKGDKITKETADKLFKSDLKVAYSGMHRLFKQWESEGNNVLISQEQFDAMVSMTFNMGVSGLRRTEFIQLLKKGDILAADKQIEITGVSYPGHIPRRAKEGDFFYQEIPSKIKSFESFSF